MIDPQGEDVLAKGTHEGFQWLVRHNQMGCRCGYVKIPFGHPWHKQDYDEIEAEIHGGLTYSNFEQTSRRIATTPWWVGFDCCHGIDACDPDLPNELPEFVMKLRNRHGVIRTQEYVEAECRRLCEQAREAQDD